MNRPTARKSQRHNCANYSCLDHWAEGLIKVDAGTVSETAENPTSLVALQCTVRLELVFKHPLATHNVVVRRPWNKISGMVHQQSIEFLLHSASPIWISKTASVGARNRRERRGGVDGWEPQPTLRTCDHPMLVRHGLRRNGTTWKRARGRSIDGPTSVDVDVLTQRT